MDEKLLRHKAFSGLVFFLIALFVMLFLPAWTLDWPAAWAYWILFAISVILITFYFLKVDPKLIESRLQAGPGAEREKSQKLIQAFTMIAFILLLIVPGLDHRFGWSQVPFAGIIASDLFAVVGLFIVFLTFRENQYTSAIIEVGKGQTVISTGPYAVVRHPMYAGASLLLLATPFALGSLWALIPAIAMIAGICWRLTEEEKFLAVNLPGYTEYRTKTRYRLIPFVW